MNCSPTFEDGNLTGYKYRQLGIIEIRRRDKSIMAAEARRKKSILNKKMKSVRSEKEDVEFRLYQLEKKKQSLSDYIGKLSTEIQEWDKQDREASSVVRKLDKEINDTKRKEKIWIDKNKCQVYKKIVLQKE